MTERTSRRQLLRSLGGLLPGAALLSMTRPAGGAATLTLQLSWSVASGRIGEVVAQSLGYFEAEGLQVKIAPGGPNVDGVAIVASGSAHVGNIASSPALMLARAGGLPVKCIASGYQEHPFAFFSLPRRPIRTPRDMIGKRIGVQATARVLLRALLAKHGIAESDVQVVMVGADVNPLLTGQVDATASWLTNTGLLKPLGPDRVELRLWDAGIRLYAQVYYATDQMVRRHGDILAGFVRGAAKGWAFTHARPEEAVDLMVKAYPNMDRAAELEAVRSTLRFSFTKTTAEKGWGTMDPTVWEEQLRMFETLGQFKGPAPKVDDVMTPAVLDATTGARPRIG